MARPGIEPRTSGLRVRCRTDCARTCTNDDVGLTLTFYGKIQFTFQAFTWEEFIELVGALDANINKCSNINEYINIFAIRSFFDLYPLPALNNHVYSNDELTFGLFTQVSDSGSYAL